MLGFAPCLADPDLWCKAEKQPDDGHEHCSFMLLCCDDAVCIHHDALSVLNKLDKIFKFESGSIGDPDVFLGTKLKKSKLPNSFSAWGMIPSKHVQEAVAQLELKLAASQQHLPKRVCSPHPSGCSVELDESPELSAHKAEEFQSLIGVLRWCVEIGRVDVIAEVLLCLPIWLHQGRGTLMLCITSLDISNPSTALE